MGIGIGFITEMGKTHLLFILEQGTKDIIQPLTVNFLLH